MDPWSLFIYAMKAPMTKDRYKTRVTKFFDFIGLDKEGQTVQDKLEYSQIEVEKILTGPLVTF